MDERLRSVGLDVGTTTTQLIVSELAVRNRASGFAVPEMEITDRRIVYRGEVYFTPLLDESHVDGAAIRALVAAEYEKAGITRQTVDTGAIIITGETSRKENARAVLENLADLAGEFVVATAGPDLESVMAAKGAGAVEHSLRTGKTVLHFDIGGGTSNWALVEMGKIIRTGCLNVGGRLVKFHSDGRVSYVSPVLEGLCKLIPGEYPPAGEVEAVGQLLARALEMAAGLRKPDALLHRLTTREAAGPEGADAPRGTVISFSGGVADCIDREHPELAFGDMGPVLGRMIRKSLLCRGEYVLGTETIRATVIGAGCHSTQLSGSTVFYRNITFPVKNLPVVTGLGAMKRLDGPGVLALPGIQSPGYGQVLALAESIREEAPAGPLYIALEADMAKALGNALALRLPERTPLLCIDRVRLQEGDYLDVGEPVGPALPVVVKTLILGR